MDKYMSINDPITVEWDDKRERWYLMRGRETFYDEDRVWIQFDTKEEAEEYRETIRKGAYHGKRNGKKILD
jgi:hypothetical protein